jgi:hypothetical protein
VELLSGITAYPFAAFLVSVVFAVLYALQRNTVHGIAAAVWAVYGCYEYLMYARILCSGECNIRVDLLVIYPALLIVSVLSVVSLFGRNSN